MKRVVKVVLILLICIIFFIAGLLCGFYFGKNKYRTLDSHETTRLELDNKRLSEANDSLKIVALYFKDRSDEFADEVKKLYEEISENNKKINDNKKKYEAEMSRFNILDGDELYRIFTERLEK